MYDVSRIPKKGEPSVQDDNLPLVSGGSHGPDNPSAPEFSEDAIALEFSARYGNDLRYVDGLSGWLAYRKRLWSRLETHYVLDLARRLAREFADRCWDSRVAMKLASAATVAAVERLARGDQRHYASVDQWDRDPCVINTPAGVVELRTGKIRGPYREDYFTKTTAVRPSGDCPVWRLFLATTTGGDGELEDFLQRMAGYCLTGQTREHALFFLYGTGANGKSTFLNTIGRIMDGYHRTAPIDTFVQTRSDRHPTELAMLLGARLVTSIETEEGRRWAEARVKAITGGDSITARFMRQDFFEYRPTFKLIISGNHKPHFSNVDEALRRRLHLIPFAVTIPENERDKELSDRLRKEWPGILQWMIDGAVEWYRHGLDVPKIVRTATEQYISNEDAFAEWIERCCVTGSDLWCSNKALFQSWKTECETNGEPAKKNKFLSALEARGFSREREAGTGNRGFRGIALRTRSTEV